MYIHQRWSAGATYGIIFYLLSNLKSTLHTTSDSGVDPGIFLGGANLKKLEKMTSADICRAEDWWSFFCFYAYLEKIGKKSWKNWKKSWKNFSGGGGCIPPIPPPGSIPAHQNDIIKLSQNKGIYIMCLNLCCEMI